MCLSVRPNVPVSIRIPDYVSEDVFYVRCVQRRLLRVQQWNARARQLPLAQVQVIAEELEELLTRNFIFAPERVIDAVFRHNRKLARKASMQPGSSKRLYKRNHLSNALVCQNSTILTTSVRISLSHDLSYIEMWHKTEYVVLSCVAHMPRCKQHTAPPVIFY